MFGSLMLAAMLAHHGSPWLAFALGVLTLAVFVLRVAASAVGVEEVDDG